ncbi:MAG: ATP-dependent Clp protease proteolytic subunit [Planctomycetota bacterium]|nr:ATP-dependent Clp protease proteolytic subunit [Planctomycetota bacterium]
MLESEAMLEEMDAAEDPLEFAIIGDLSDSESELSEKILSVPIGGECTIFFDSPGGSVYSALSLMTLIATREIRATGIITGECSSAAIWPFAACCYRKVTPFSVMLFHRMKWQSEEQVGLGEASEWARHFAQLEQEMDSLLTRFFGTASQQVEQWIRESRYITGRELVEAGLADLVELSPVRPLRDEGNDGSPGAQQESDKLKTAHVA